jgi:hypothetical protein
VAQVEVVTKSGHTCNALHGQAGVENSTQHKTLLLLVAHRGVSQLLLTELGWQPQPQVLQPHCMFRRCGRDVSGVCCK